MDTDALTVGIIGGSGLGEALGGEAARGTTEHTPDTPFGRPSSPIVEVDWHGTRVLLLRRHGDGHVLNPSAIPYRANIFALKALGATHVLASGATGSLREHIEPGHLVIADQVIDRTHRRATTFYERAAVHCELAEPFCPVMRRWLLDAANREGMRVVGRSADGEGTVVHDGGTYVCMEGPQFSTRAESEMHRGWGGDLIGMTCMPEAKLAREAELAYALVAMPTDYDCWRPHPRNPDTPPQALLEEIIGNLQKATAANLALMKAALADVSTLKEHPSPAHDALRLAIWSDKSQIDPAEVDRLRPLWGRHVE